MGIFPAFISTITLKIFDKIRILLRAVIRLHFSCFHRLNMGKKHHGQNQVRKRDRHTSDGLKKFAHDYSKDYTDPKWPYAQGKMDKYGFYELQI